MEILSTGEKIKRARIYKGITLKEICDDKISISKMSCIENGKVNAEDWILEEVAKKLDLDVKYLRQDVREQLDINIEGLRNMKDNEQLEREALYSLEYAKEYQIFDKAFELMHILFDYYLNVRSYDKIQINISEYHYFLQKAWNDEHHLIYNYDIARYLSANGEYLEALIYYKEIRKTLLKDTDINNRRLGKATFYVAETLMKLNKTEEALKIAEDNIALIDFLDSSEEMGRVYEMLAVLCVKADKASFDTYMDMAMKAFEGNNECKARLYLRIGEEFFNKHKQEEGLLHIQKSLNIVLKEKKESYTECLLSCIEELISNDYYKVAEELCEDALDRAIKFNNIALIEKAYYLKALVLKSQGNFIQAEMYMNFSLDALLKFASKEQRRSRYMDVAALYYDIGEVKDSIKYFMLAFSEEKKM